jgi:hypothetical protein
VIKSIQEDAHSLGRPYARFYLNAAQSIPNVTWTEIGWNAVDTDPFQALNPATPGRMYVRVPGRYRIQTQVTWAPDNVGGFRGIRILKVNNLTLLRAQAILPSSQQQNNRTGTLIEAYDFVGATNEYYSTQVYQNTGAALAIQGTAAGADLGTMMSIEYMGRVS